MKKVMTLLLASVFALGAVSAEGKSDNLYLGGGLVVDGTFKVAEKPTLNLFMGYGFRVVDGLPLFIGVEGLIGIQKIGESTATSADYVTILIDTGDFTYYSQSGTYWKNEANFWNIDLSPRVYASLDLSDMIQGLVYAGLNFNRVTYDTKNTAYSDPAMTTLDGSVNPNPVQKDGILYQGETMFTTGFRITVSIVYFEYQRLFAFKERKGNVDWNAVDNRMSLGVNFRM